MSTADLQCARCQSALGDSYYLQNQAARICSACQTQLTGPPRLRGWEAFLRTLFLGGLASLVCGLLAALPIVLFDRILALVWILLAALISSAVKSASESRGTTLYRLMAVGFTYCAIGLSILFTLIYFAVVGFPKEDEKGSPGGPAFLSRVSLPTGQPRPVAASPTAAPTPTVAQTPQASATPEPLEGMNENSKAALGIVLICAIPFLVVGLAPVGMAYFSPVSGFIYLYALYLAWKSSARDALDLSGPHPIEDTQSP